MSVRDLHSGSDSDEDLRLEDISRRSACDRCRGMKTRCERSRHRGIAQLTQCRRCVQAQVRCITTLEGQPSRSQQPDRSYQRPRKRTRESSVRPDNSYEPLPAQTDSILPYPEDPAAPNRPLPASLHPSPPREDPAVLSDGVDISNWNDMDDFLHLGANLAAGNPSDSMRGPRIAELHTPTSAVPLSLHGTTGSGRMTPQLAAHSQRRTEQGQHESWKNWSLAPAELLEPGPTNTTQSIMVRLQEFNALLLHDLQVAREASGGRDGEQHGQGSLIATTLQRSDMFLQLIRELSHSVNSDRSDQWNKVDTDVVLQLLSCNIAIGHLYQMLCSRLRAWSAPSAEWDKGSSSALPSLRLEGLARMDAELHLSTLAHVCGHVFAKIQKELEKMQRREVLTQAAHTTFEIALGVTGREDEVVERGHLSVKTKVVETLQLLANRMV